MACDNQQFPNKISFLNINRYNSFFDEYSRSIGEPVPNSKCERIKDVLKHFDHHDELYTINDLRKKKITWEHGIDKWLDYPAAEERPIDYIDTLVHPFLCDWYCAFAAGTLHYFLTSFKNASFLQTRYVINIPLRKKNGTYMAVKQMTMPFEFDENNNIVSTLNSYTIFDKYRGQPLKTRIFEGNKRLHQVEEDVKKTIAPNLVISRKANLTRKHFDIINAIQDLSDEKSKINWPNIAEVMNRAVPRNKAIPDSIRQYLSKEGKSRMKHLLHIGFLQKACQDDQWEYQKSILPDYNDQFELVEFLVKSGIKDILYYKFLLHDPI